VFGASEPKGNGILYQANSSGDVIGLGSFTGLNGSNPHGKVALATDGKIYGTTQLGGANNLGTVFSATTNGIINALYSLDNSSGSYPYAGLTMGPDGQLYGATWANLASCFKITTNGIYNKISFLGGYAYAYGGLAIGSDGVSLYGTWEKNSNLSGFGSIYRITTNGSYSTFYNFSSINGAFPRSDLTLGIDSNLYGTTFQGGAFNRGTVFQVTTNRTLTSLLSFDGTNGMSPHASIVFAGDGNFYGTTTYGGTYNAGVIYRIHAPPVLLTQPYSQTNVAGSSISMTVSVDGVPPFSYQWFKDAAPIGDGTHIHGSTTNTVLIEGISSSDAGSYSVNVTNNFGAVTSLAADLVVITPPSILVDDGYFGFSSNGFGFSVTGSIGSVLILQSSTNLTDWMPFASLTNETGTVFFADPNTNRACQFYRALQQ